MVAPDLPGDAPAGASVIPTASFLDNVLYHVVHVLPYYTQGVFTRSRFWVTFWTRVHPDPLGVRFVSYLRRKYRSRYLYLYVLASKSLLVLDVEGIRHVLERSPFIYADAKLKRKGMEHFQPDALTISRGDEWRDRRRFNEAVLAARVTDGSPHELAGHILESIGREVAETERRAGQSLTWNHLQELFEKVTLQVIFGSTARHDTGLMATLWQLMGESNRVFGLRRSKHYDRLYSAIRAYLGAPEAGSLAELCRRAPTSAVTEVAHQIPHWMFATSETLAINAARALALIVSHSSAEARVRDELAGVDVSSPKDIQRLAYLEGCLQEAMRLWPTTPMLVRETVTEDTLGGAHIAAGTPVVILNSFNHRDRETVPFADTFTPEWWAGTPGARSDYRFNHFSNGTQVCPGQDLALFIGKAILATLLSRGNYHLRKPPLDPAKPLPHAYNHFELVFTRSVH